MIPRLTVHVGPDHDLLHTSMVLTGVCALAREGAVALRYRVADGDARWLAADPIVVCMDVEGDAPVRIAIDLRDGEGISQPIIDRVQWYFKRAYYPAELEALPPGIASRMRPFGMNYGCRSAESTLRLLAAIGLPLAARGRPGLGRLRQYLSIPSCSAFVESPETPVEPWVAFQTRLWTADEVPASEVAPLNEGRVAMVRALRQAFGERFIGGLVPTAYAREHYPDEITPHSSHYPTYLALKKRCLIGVYTRGVEHSLAFKLGETFAASQCLVSVPLRYGLPSPLEAGRHYLPFETTEACVAACRRLLDDPALALAMRRANHEYYAREIAPAAHVRRVLERIGVLPAAAG